MDSFGLLLLPVPFPASPSAKATAPKWGTSATRWTPCAYVGLDVRGKRHRAVAQRLPWRRSRGPPATWGSARRAPRAWRFGHAPLLPHSPSCPLRPLRSGPYARREGQSPAPRALIGCPPRTRTRRDRGEGRAPGSRGRLPGSHGRFPRRLQPRAGPNGPGADSLRVAVDPRLGVGGVPRCVGVLSGPFPSRTGNSRSNLPGSRVHEEGAGSEQNSIAP